MRFGPPPRMTTFFLLGRRRLVGGAAGERRLVGRIHVGGRRGEFGGAGVDALEHRTHAERAAAIGDFVGREPGQPAEPRIGKAHRFQPPQRRWRSPEARASRICVFGLDDVADLRQEPRIDVAGGMNVVIAHAEPHGLRDFEDAVGRGRAERGADRVLVVALAEPGDRDFVETGQAGFQRAQRLLQAFGKGAADRHRLADRFHRRGQHRLGAGKFLEGEARHLGDDVIDGRLERGRRRAAGDVVFDLVERVADRELGGDLGDRESRSPSRPAPRSATPADSFR